MCAIALNFSLSGEAQQSTTFTLSNIGTTGGTSSPGGPGAYTVNGAGAGIKGENDSFSFLKIQTNGNVEMITKVTSQQNTNNYAIAGLMIRETLDADSAHATVGVSPANGINFYTRAKSPPTNRPTKVTLGPTSTPPVWLRIAKSGNTISGFSSSNGYSDWKLIGQTTLELSQTFYIGFAVASFADPTLSTAQFSNTVFMRDVPQRNPDMLLWLRADQGITENSGTISSWQDQSGFGNNAAQPTGTLQPKIATAALNGLPAIDFAKVTTNRWLQVPPGFSDLTNGVSIFVVAQSPGTVSNSRIVDFGNNTSSNNAQLYQASTSTWTFRAYNGNNGKSVETSSVAGSGYKLISVVHDGNYQATVYVNGSQVGIKNGAADMNNFIDIQRTGNFIGKAFGSADYWEGKIAEVIVIKRGVSVLERKSLESYFYYKYGSSVVSSPKPVPPTMSLNSGAYSSSQTLTMTPPPLVSEIRYTTNGTDPGVSVGNVYSSPISVSTSTMFKAVSVAGGQASDVVTTVIDIDANSVDVSRLGLNLWLKANIGVENSSGAVTTWHDLSGSNFNATQTESVDRPTLTTGTVGSSTKPVVAFSEVNSQWLNLPKGMKTGFSMFAVAKATKQGARRIVDLTDQDASTVQATVQGNDTFRYRVFNPSSSVLDSPTLNLTTHKLYEIIHNGSSTNAVIYTNGANPYPSTTMNTIAPVARSSNYIGRDFGGGGNSFFDGEIAELLIYTRALTDDERRGVEAYCFAKYGTPVSAMPTLPPPVIQPSNTTVTTNIVATVTATNDAEIYYTVDGSEPTQSSNHYNPAEGIDIEATTTVKAKAFKTNFTASAVATSTIIKNPNAGGIVNENLILWLNAQNVVGNHGDAVSSWGDGSGKLNNATQTTGANQPLLEKPAQNGMPSVKFDGSNDFMQFSNSSFANFTQGMTVFCVAKPSSSSAGRFIDFGNALSSDNIQFYQQNGTNFALSVLTGASASTINSSGVTSGTFKLFEARQNGAGAATLHVNGSQTASSSVSNITNITRTGNFLGKAFNSSNHFNGQIAELLVYDKILPEATCKVIEQYLIGKYALLATAQPVISPAVGVFPAGKQIVITHPTPGAAIYYDTAGGPDPTTPYNGPFPVSVSSTISAKAVLNGIASTPPVYAYIQIDGNTKNLPRESMLLWLKSDYWLSSGGVASWRDVSGSGNSATQSNVSKQPTCVSNAVNGLSAVEFSGTDKWMQLPTIASDFNNGMTLYVVNKPSAVDINDRILDMGTGSTANNLLLTLESTTASRFWTSGNASDSILGAGSVSTGAYKALEVIHTGREAAAIFSDGTQSKALTSIPNPTTADRTANYIGQSNAGANYFAGRIAEIILYDRILTPDERLQVQAYLVGRYALDSGKVIRPTISPLSGIYTGNQKVSMTAFPGASIHYTLTGANPDGSSPTYSSPIDITGTTTVKAIAKHESNLSAVSTNLIQLDPRANNVPRNGINLWLNGDFGLSVAPGTTLVTDWLDASGYGHDASQTDSGKRPDVTNEFGFPLVNTQLLSGVVSHPTHLDIAAGLSDFSNGLSFYAMTIPKTTTGTDNVLLNASNGLSNNNIEFRNLPGSGRAKARIRQGTGGVQQIQTPASDFPLDKLQVFEVKQSGANTAQIFINGVEKASSGLDNARNVTRLTNKLGANADASSTEFYKGGTGELFLFNRPLSDTERTQVLSYLASKFQLLSSTTLAPVITPSGGSYGAPLQVAITAPIGATIRYTTNGDDPAGTGSVKTYAQPFRVYFTQQVRAIATYQGVNSSESTQTFTLESTLWPAPNASDTTPLDLQLQFPTTAVPQ